MHKQIYIGTAGFPIKDKTKVLTAVDAVEMQDARFIPPGTKAARHILEGLGGKAETTVQISEYFVKAPPEKATLKGRIENYGGFATTDEMKGLWNRQLAFASTVGAKAMVLLTPPEFRPSAGNVAQIKDFFTTMPKTDIPIFWEPKGPWSAPQVQKVADDIGLLRAVDPLQDDIPPGEMAYLRFGPFSTGGSRMAIHELEKIILAAMSCEASTVFCVFDTRNALDDARNMRKFLNEELEIDYSY